MKKLKVIIADDNDEFRFLLSSFLKERMEFDVVAETSSGSEAVMLSTIHRPDVVFLDINMPELNGLEAARQIKQFVPTTKIVLITGMDDGSYRTVAEMIGVHGFVSKSALPIEFPFVLNQIVSESKESLV
ncbi:MAG: response regulator transcription factor [Ignavibacteriales bacterium]|nr:response regulator transcription factor [Ignavibacteriales bacterium]